MSIMLHFMTIRGRSVFEFSDVHRGSQLTTDGRCSNRKIEDPLYTRDLEILSGEFYNVTLLEFSNHIESSGMVDPSMGGEKFTACVPDIPEMDRPSLYTSFSIRATSTENCDESDSLTPEGL